MKQIIISMLLVTVLLISCSSLFYTADYDIKKVQLGMAKRDILKVMGNDYEMIYMSKGSDNVFVEVMGYRTYVNGGIYKLYLEDNELVQIEKEWLDLHNCHHSTNTSDSNDSSTN